MERVERIKQDVAGGNAASRTVDGQQEPFDVVVGGGPADGSKHQPGVTVAEKGALISQSDQPFEPDPDNLGGSAAA